MVFVNLEDSELDLNLEPSFLSQKLFISLNLEMFANLQIIKVHFMEGKIMLVVKKVIENIIQNKNNAETLNALQKDKTKLFI